MRPISPNSRTSGPGLSRLGCVNPTRRLADMLPETLEWIESMGGAGLYGVPTGLADLDALTKGFQPGSLVVIGAGPVAGKTTLLLDFCRSATLRHSLPSALFSLDKTRQELGLRLLAAEARVPMHVLRGGLLSDDDRTRLARRTADIADAPLYVNDTRLLTVQALCDEATRLVREHGVRLIAVDYLQLIMPGLRGETREREVSEITRRLKALAVDLAVPVVVAAQLNRDRRGPADKRPVLADLRESEAITQAADLVILLHREDAYERDGPRAGEADLLVHWHRDGPTAEITVAFQGHFSRFVDMTSGPMPTS
jgi:replicative DNA helicase